MHRLSRSTLSRWARPTLGFLAIVFAIGLLSSALVRTGSVAKATAGSPQDAAAPEATTATFAADVPSLGAIPDANPSTGTCQTASTTQRDVTFTVTGMTGPISTVAVNFNASHTFIQDLELTLTAPSAQSHLLFSATGTTSTTPNACSNGNNLLSTNTYTFADSAAANWWTTAASAVSIPTSSNRTVVTGIGGAPNPPPVTSLNTAFAAATANGTWTLRFRDRGAGDTGTVTAANLTITTSAPGGCTAAKRPLDFDGNGTTEFQTVRNTGGGPTGQVTWFTNPTPPQGFAIPWGIATDFFVPADYDGDNKSDVAVWRAGPPFGSNFFIFQSLTNTLRTVTFGQSGDDPTVIGDYDGDAKIDPAVYRGGQNAGDPSFWYYLSSVSSTEIHTQWGQNGDFPAPGDYDGDARYDFAVQRNAGGGQAGFHIKQSSGGSVGIIHGTPTDLIVPGYYDADCKTDIAVVRSIGGQHFWYIRNSTDGALQTIIWGTQATDFLAQGDYDGDGFTDVGVWRPNADPSQNFFFFRRSTDGALGNQEWGQNGDYPTANFNVH